MTKRMTRLLPVLAVGLGFTALPAAAGAADSGCATVKATLSEYKIKLNKKSVAATCVRFKTVNRGVEDHELIVVKASKPHDLPQHEGVVDEDDLDVIGETGDLATKKHKTLTVELAPGRYVVFCNVLHEHEDEGGGEMDMGHGHGEETKSESHFGEGMHVVFTVKAPSAS